MLISPLPTSNPAMRAPAAAAHPMVPTALASRDLPQLLRLVLLLLSGMCLQVVVYLMY